jgi:hypothetical protein
MKSIVLTVISMAGVACGVADPELSRATDDINFGANVFYDKFDPDNVGTINGQGWTGNCQVVAGAGADKFLECTGGPGLTNGRGAQATFVRPPNHNYHLQFDVWTRGVVDSTHGKVFLEGPPGDGSNSILQIAIGCDGIRATFEYHANTTQGLMSFPCSNGPRYRVVCIWHDGGNAFRCGAAVFPNDPVEASFITIPAISGTGAPEAIGAFDRIRVLGGIGERVGTTAFDKVQVLSD